MIHPVMAGLVPAIHDFIEIKLGFKSWMPDISRA
jgi:hypothetical protein